MHTEWTPIEYHPVFTMCILCHSQLFWCIIYNPMCVFRRTNRSDILNRLKLGFYSFEKLKPWVFFYLNKKYLSCFQGLVQGFLGLVRGINISCKRCCSSEGTRIVRVINWLHKTLQITHRIRLLLFGILNCSQDNTHSINRKIFSCKTPQISFQKALNKMR